MGAWNLLQTKEGNEYLKSLWICFGIFEYLVMWFSLTNDLSLFLSLFNYTFAKIVDEVCRVFLHNILFFSQTLTDHIQHVGIFLKRLCNHNLQAKISKCSFYTKCFNYLGFIITPNGKKMEKKKLKHIIDWPVPQNIKGVQPFLWFANFHHRFIKDSLRKT